MAPRLCGASRARRAASDVNLPDVRLQWFKFLRRESTVLVMVATSEQRSAARVPLVFRNGLIVVCIDGGHQPLPVASEID